MTSTISRVKANGLVWLALAFYPGATVTASCRVRGAFLPTGRRSWRNVPHRCHRSPPWLTSTTRMSTSVESLVEQALYRVNVTSSVQVLSRDPLIYVVPDLLTREECEAYRNYVDDETGDKSESERINSSRNRALTRSNPPAVSLDVSKLWPLPILALLAGVPPYVRFLEQTPNNGAVDALARQALLTNVVTSIGIASIVMAALAYVVVLPLIRRVSDSSSRTSVALALNEDDDIEFIRPLVNRASAAASIVTGDSFPWHRWEAPVVTKYDPGAVFAVHGDASPTQGSEWNELGGQRVVTVICYLNSLDPGTGGETCFDKLQISVAPTAGQALVFFPADNRSKRADDRTTHESLPPVSEKWIVQLFGRSERVPPPLGLPELFQ